MTADGCEQGPSRETGGVLEVQTKVFDLLSAVGNHAGFDVLLKPTTPVWLQRPGVRECGQQWPAVCEAYTALTWRTLPQQMPPRGRRQLDAVVVHADGSHRIVEIDEEQHFTPMRAITLRRYGSGTAVAFDVQAWIRRCAGVRRLRGGGFGKPKPPLFPDDGGRHQ